MKALIIKQPWIDHILNGEKDWEIRGSKTNIRGEIELIPSGSGLIAGKCCIVECKQLSLQEYRQSKQYHCIEDVDVLPYKKTFAWVLTNPKRYSKPKPYKHPRGAIIWVNV